MASGVSPRAEFRLLRPDGTLRHIESQASVIRDASGKIARVVVISRDISERIEAEQQARRYSDQIRRLLTRLTSAQESERRRLGDDLHDLIGQSLTALGLDIASIERHLQSRDDAISAKLNRMRLLVERTIHDIRGVMSELRPPGLEEFGLVPALLSLASEFRERTGIQTSVGSSSPDSRCHKDIELALFRIAQEALTNAAKHSGATSIQILVAHFPQRIQLTVQDDGCGFADPMGARTVKRGGWGLPTMRERAEALGGALRIEFPGRGTRIVVEVPRIAED
jgi:two-component system sensor histidine kinase UhpB